MLSRPSKQAGATPPTRRERLMAGLAGVMSVAVALGVSELVAALVPGGRSLLIAVGDVVIDVVPGWLERAVIETFGTADKPLLIGCILAASAAIGIVVGRLGFRGLARGAALLGLLAAIGTGASLLDPQAEPLGSLASGLSYALAGTLTLAALLWAARSDRAGEMEAARRREEARRAAARDTTAPPGAPVPGTGTSTRRRFFGVATVAVFTAAFTGMVGRRLVDGDRIDRIRRAIRLPAPARPAPPPPVGAQLSIRGISPLYVPNGVFYRIDTALIPPQVDPADWSLEVKGRVDRPFRLTYDELMAMPHIEADITLACVSNFVGGELVGNARWQGVALRDLLERAGVQGDATQVVGRAVDDFTAGFPTRTALETEDAMVAIAMNGQPLPVVHGFPARLIVPGLFGYVSATKWLSAIELTRWEDFDAYWVPRGWAKEAPIKTQSRIDVPRSGSAVRAGRRPIAGVAWAPTRGIERVEVKIDDGPWQAAELAPAIDVDTWRQWHLPWDAAPGAHTIAVRATDGTGETQTAVRRGLQPDGSTGHHTIRVSVTEPS